MIAILDRYLLGKYLRTFFFMVLIFSLISVVIDMSDKLDDFLDEKNVGITWKEIFLGYYLTFIPWINGLLIPLYSLIAVIFFTSRLAFNSELIAIIGSGVNFYRILRPYIYGAIIIAGLQFIGNHYVIPIGNKKRIAFENKYIYKNNVKSATNDIHIFTQPDTKVYMKYYSTQDSTANDFSIEHFKNGKLVYRLNAVRADWQPKERKWKLRTYYIRTIDSLKETLITGAEKDTAILNLQPKDLERRDNIMHAMTSPELREFITSERARGAGGYALYEVDLHRRTAEPFSVFILTLIGFTLAGRKVRGGMGLHLALGAILGGVFIFISKFSATLSINSSLPPAVGVWIPNMIFGVIALVLLFKAQK